MAPNLLTIPRELRDLIYEHVYTSDTIIDIGILDTCMIVPTHPLRQTCKQLSNESLEAYLKLSTFYKQSSGFWLASSWLPRVPKEMHKHIREIRLRDTTHLRNNHIKAAELKREQDLWTGYHATINRYAFKTTFTTRSGEVGWAPELPVCCFPEGRNGRKHSPAGTASLSIEEVRGMSRGTKRGGQPDRDFVKFDRFL